MKHPPQLLTLTMPQLRIHAAMAAATKIAKCPDDDALRTLMALHPAELREWAQDMGVVANYFEQWAAAVREAQERMAPIVITAWP